MTESSRRLTTSGWANASPKLSSVSSTAPMIDHLWSRTARSTSHAPDLNVWLLCC